MNKTTGFTRIIMAIHYSLAGFKAAWRTEESFRQEVLLFITLLPIALWLGENGLERAILVASLLWVLLAELLNSAIEALADLIAQKNLETTEKWHPLIKKAKDLGSAAVFLAIWSSVLVWGLVLFLP